MHLNDKNLPVSQAQAWAALNDVEMLRRRSPAANP